MRKIRGDKWNRRICKWIASLLTVALLVNQNCFLVLAEESDEGGEKVCLCDTRCSADSVNEACSVCAEGYENCGGAEAGSDNDTGEEPENPGTGDGENTGMGTETTPEETVPDTGTGEETENPDAGEDTVIDEETEDSDAGEDEGVNTDADTEAASEVDADDEVDTLLEDDEAENVGEEDAVSRASGETTFTYDGFIYKITDESNLQVEVVRHEDGTYASGDLVIPPKVLRGTDQYTVVGIGMHAFHYCSNLESISIPDSVTSIGEGAFGSCSSLTSITIPNGVVSIEHGTFGACSSLTNITIPNSVISIGEFAFSSCGSLTSITIPNGVISIGNDAFFYCSSLESITIPGSVASIAFDTFDGCTSLKSIIILEGVTSIGEQAFFECSSLESITIPKSVTSIGERAFAYCGSLASVTILNEKIVHSAAAFNKCNNLNSFRIALSGDITETPTIGSNCFRECPDDRYLIFLTEDGTTELSDTTTLAAAVKAYDAADGTKDGKWYGWKLPDDPDPDVTDYQVTIKVNKDGGEWSDCAKVFALSADNGVTFTTDLTKVPNGTYTIYDITGASDSAGYVNTKVTIEVKGADVQAEVNYYSVTFYNGDTIFGGKIVPANTTVSAPSDTPTKDGHTFYRWVTSEDGSTQFDFNNPITARTDIYASWIADEEELFTITASAGVGGSVTPNGDVEVKSGANQQFAITPEDGYRIASVLVDDNEVLGSLQVINYLRAAGTGTENNTRYYIFENVTGNHTLAAYFEVISTGGNGSEGSGGGDNNDNSDSEGFGGGDINDNSGSGSFGGSDSSDNGNSDSSGSNDAGDNSGSGDARNNTNGNGGSDSSDGNNSATSSHTGVSSNAGVINISNTAPASKDNEPKTGDASCMEIYATIAMVAGLSYLLLYFADGKNGMTEEEKKEIIAALVKWAKKGKCFRKYVALAMIFLILVYYHSIGKRTTVDWKEVYEK